MLFKFSLEIFGKPLTNPEPPMVGGSGVSILGTNWGGDTFIWGAHN